jgi:ABC-type phosphate transport system substrate-binding protein
MRIRLALKSRSRKPGRKVPASAPHHGHRRSRRAHVPHAPDERLTLVFAPGANSCPLINYEYAIVSEKQPNAQVAAAMSNFLLWCISPQGGSAASFLDPVHFIELPASIRARSEIQIAKIQ